jgi:hypothetical protein
MYTDKYIAILEEENARLKNEMLNLKKASKRLLMIGFLPLTNGMRL